MADGEKCLLEGIISVKAAVSSGKRKIEKVYVDAEKKSKRDRKIIQLLSFLKETGTPFEVSARENIDEIASAYPDFGHSHGGVIAIASERVFDDLEGMLRSAKDGEYIVFLDGVEDPYNFGYSIRTLFAFGVRNFIVPYRNWMSSANVVARSSAGASEMCGIAAALEDDRETARLIKDSGLDIVCSAVAANSVSVYDFKSDRPYVLIIGGEKRGISKDFMDEADKIVHIPYRNDDARYSLPTASVCAVYGAVFAKNPKDFSQ